MSPTVATTRSVRFAHSGRIRRAAGLGLLSGEFMRMGKDGAAAATLQESPPPSHTCMAVSDFAAWLVCPAVAGAAAFVVGSMAGSFLNVVAHRVPRRETVVFGRSRCPACGATIRPYDNVPVFGWLALGGRCRDCRAAIPARYPLVEAGCGALAAVLAVAEVMAVGDDPAALVGWGARTAVTLALVAWALLAERGHAVSGATVGTATVAAAVAAACLPTLAPLPVVCPPAAWASTAAWPGCLLASLAGLAVGWLAGAADGGPTRAACGLVGATLGWQAAAVAALAARAASRCSRHAGAGPLAAVVAVACWHPLQWTWAAACRAVAAAG